MALSRWKLQEMIVCFLFTVLNAHSRLGQNGRTNSGWDSGKNLGPFWDGYGTLVTKLHHCKTYQKPFFGRSIHCRYDKMLTKLWPKHRGLWVRAPIQARFELSTLKTFCINQYFDIICKPVFSSFVYLLSNQIPEQRETNPIYLIPN